MWPCCPFITKVPWAPQTSLPGSLATGLWQPLQLLKFWQWSVSLFLPFSSPPFVFVFYCSTGCFRSGGTSEMRRKVIWRLSQSCKHCKFRIVSSALHVQSVHDLTVMASIVSQVSQDCFHIVNTDATLAHRSCLVGLQNTHTHTFLGTLIIYSINSFFLLTAVVHINVLYFIN